jgi:hypothetical protein
MTKPWKPYACTVPTTGVTGTCSVLSTVHHVTHTEPALRILADGKVTRGLIYDESILNDSRTTVVWLSPNNWYNGSRYGCVQFTFDFADIVARRKIYWVEVREYKRHACRFIISDQDLSKLPVTAYDPTKEEGPLRHVGGVWYWNSEHTAEFLLDSSLLLHYCKKVDFILHHDKFCAAPGGCGELGHDGTNAAGRVLAFLLARGFRGFNDTLIDTEPKTALSTAAERGILHAYEQISADLGGPAKTNDNVDAALCAALLQLAIGEATLAQATAKLIGSDDLLTRRLAELVKRHFKLESTALKF